MTDGDANDTWEQMVGSDGFGATSPSSNILINEFPSAPVNQYVYPRIHIYLCQMMMMMKNE